MTASPGKPLKLRHPSVQPRKQRVTLLLVTPYVAEVDGKGRIVAGPSPVGNGNGQPLQVTINEAQIEDWKWPPEFRKLLAGLVAKPETPKPERKVRTPKKKL